MDNLTPEEIDQKYAEIEAIPGGFYHDKSTPRIKFAEALEKTGQQELAAQLRVEAGAFFLTSRGDAFPGYFQPTFVYTNGATSPSRDYFTPERLVLLAKRAKETSSPSCAAHYADVCWDLSSPKDPEMARLASDKYLESARQYWAARKGLDFGEAINRAVQLAASIKDSTRLAGLISEIISRLQDLERRQEYRYALDLADALADTKDLFPSDKEQKTIVEILNNGAAYYQKAHPKVEHSFGPVAGPNEHFVRSFVERKSALLRLWGDKSVAPDALKLEEAQSYDREAENAPNYLARLVFLRDAEKLYGELGRADDVSRIRVAMVKAGKLAESEMKEIRSEIKIDHAKIDEYISPIIGPTLADSLNRLSTTFRFIPDLETSRDSVSESQKEHPLQTFIPKVIVKDGHLVGSPSSREELFEDSVLRDYVMGIHVSGVFRGRLLERLAKEQGLTKDVLLEHFCTWGYCKEKHLRFLGIGVEHYFKGDNASAIHVLVPQFEDILRWLLEQAGQPVSDPRRGKFLLLDSLLKNELFQATAGKTLIDWYRLSLSAPTGLNLRNDVAHGLSSPEKMTREMVELVIHLLLSLTRFTLKESSEADDKTETPA